MSNPFNLRVIEEFRANGGVVSGDFAGTELLLLTTVGARSGEARTTPLVYLRHHDGRLAVFALNGGDPAAPAWYHNLRAHPDRLTAEVGGGAYRVLAEEVADEGEYEELWRRQIAVEPKFADFRARAGRRVPVILLRQEVPTAAASAGSTPMVWATRSPSM
ncbi:nitroreductase family deazaflavin-dependent oxidoreductase [Streptomyces sp. AV19]|uniref:nitroreductase/quinone reductase family protein n=1 Tax=Streptomyces sp. AV19 TaxID=2793068 RepID=UPI0018FECE59|nr:nitroreductase/quinone reductase family protein [Streptomyces sp. AV19]MBH1933484.1 nitroreductase family deazaflavin-dependent oxidoreductase [Streptomyces sp. AV19]MDG4532133.1 nitroreductase family deazaflavin-dependent oxidoreductase [Streptomyces sp. AV19]